MTVIYGDAVATKLADEIAATSRKLFGDQLGHDTASAVALVGGGSNPRPGEVSMAMCMR